MAIKTTAERGRSSCKYSDRSFSHGIRCAFADCVDPGGLVMNVSKVFIANTLGWKYNKFQYLVWGNSGNVSVRGTVIHADASIN